jgi:hypothetical protein
VTKDELIRKLRSVEMDTAIRDNPWLDKAYGPGLHIDSERAHHVADQLLIEFINDPEVTQAFEEIRKWYA